MMTIQELRNTLFEETKKRDFLYETTPANSQMLKEKCGGTFEAVLTENGDEKCLIPQVGTLHFLYRGQNKEFIPCQPSLYRGNPTEDEIFVERMRLVVFRRLLNSHPVVKYFFQRHHFLVDYEGLAQHYGLKTSVLDLTSSLDIALFFATCQYDDASDSYYPYDDGKEHDAILYVFIPILDNEPSPSLDAGEYLNGNIRPIGLQAFPRPGVQEGYGVHIPKGGSIKCYMYHFSFSCDDSLHYYNYFTEKAAGTGKDILIQKANEIKNQTEFSYSVFNEAFRLYGPQGFSTGKMKSCLSSSIKLSDDVEDLLFSSDESKAIIDEWNNGIGPIMASKIYRKYWFEHDSIAIGEDNIKQTITGIRNRHDYRTLKRISVQMMLNLVACPNPLSGSKWVNYENTPRKSHSHVKETGWQKVPASMECMFGKPYLTEEDWKIACVL